MNELINRVNEVFEKLTKLRAEHRVFEETFDELYKRAPAESRAEVGREFFKRYEAHLDELEENLKQVAVLAKRSQEGQPAAEAIKPDDLARHFRSVIENLQRDARQPQEGESAAIIKSLDIEVKGLIVVEQNETRIVTPTPGSTVEANKLSTIRMSFGAIPVLRPTESGTEKPR